MSDMETIPINSEKQNGAKEMENGGSGQSACDNITSALDAAVDKLFLTCGIKVFKYIVICLNVILALLGLFMMIAAAIVLLALTGPKSGAFFQGSLNYTMYFTLAAGFLVIVLSILGGCGAYRENKCLVITYTINMFVLLLLQIALIIIVCILRGQLRGIIMDRLQDTLTDFSPNASSSTTFTVPWNKLQEELYCCGLTSYQNWQINQFYKNTQNLPDSCCVKPKAGCGKNSLTTLHGIETAPCKDKLEAWLISNIWVAFCFGIPLIIFQLMAICCGCRLSGDVKQFYQNIS